jgi:2-hydroxycyclohexanecarboxyl-CoA dehydrogenase
MNDVKTQGIALVTGAGSGIGRSISIALNNSGWRVLGVDRVFSEEKADHLYEQLIIDLADQTGLRTALQSLVADHAIDCLVNCAGITHVGPFLEHPQQNWQQLLEVNYLAPLAACQVLLPPMIERQRGSIIQITSDSGRTGAAGEAVYAGSKSALVAFSKSLAQEVGRYNIRVNCVSPGVVRTPMSAPNQDLLEKFAKRVPLKRLGEPQDIAAAVNFLASDEAAYITGQVLSVGGGLTMVD